MFKAKDSALTKYASISLPGNRNFEYMNVYNSTTTVTIPNCYYYAKEV